MDGERLAQLNAEARALAGEKLSVSGMQTIV